MTDADGRVVLAGFIKIEIAKQVNDIVTDIFNKGTLTNGRFPTEETPCSPIVSPSEFTIRGVSTPSLIVFASAYLLSEVTF